MKKLIIFVTVIITYLVFNFPVLANTTNNSPAWKIIYQGTDKVINLHTLTARLNPDLGKQYICFAATEAQSPWTTMLYCYDGTSVKKVFYEGDDINLNEDSKNNLYLSFFSGTTPQSQNQSGRITLLEKTNSSGHK